MTARRRHLVAVADPSPLATPDASTRDPRDASPLVVAAGDLLAALERRPVELVGPDVFATVDVDEVRRRAAGVTFTPRGDPR